MKIHNGLEKKTSILVDFFFLPIIEIILFYGIIIEYLIILLIFL